MTRPHPFQASLMPDRCVCGETLNDGPHGFGYVGLAAAPVVPQPQPVPTPVPWNTRRGQVLHRLRLAKGEWVSGVELATAEVGGSEGLKRLRELRAMGYPIEERPHPDAGRSSWQYRIVE
jgi:hypothetical protein